MAPQPGKKGDNLSGEDQGLCSAGFGACALLLGMKGGWQELLPWKLQGT